MTPDHIGTIKCVGRFCITLERLGDAYTVWIRSLDGRSFSFGFSMAHEFNVGPCDTAEAAFAAAEAAIGAGEIF
jgi:hypothetical protein